ncbi:MAG TPA: FAD/NAD(P)-binding oxidoreductase [Thermoleophilia bacterium]|nr:FAD/NAD(P)-binding oxidoreductase [Thermoleophilia bacterium]
MTDKTVVVLGGGIGGLTAARWLRRHLDADDRVVLVDRDARPVFAPSLAWVMTGVRAPESIRRPLAALRRRGIEFRRAETQAIDAGERVVDTSDGPLRFDRLVLALGAETAPGDLPGFAEAAHDFYTLAGATSARDHLRTFSGGRVAVLVSQLPYKCPAAPCEAAFLAEAVLRARGVRAQVDIYTPEPFPLPTAGQAVGEAVRSMLGARGIGYQSGRQVERIEPEARRLVFTDASTTDYDLLLGIPPHRAPAVLGESGLAAPSGWGAVDAATLATSAEGIYAIGDATAIPIAGGKLLPKAGVFAHAQAKVVARRIADELAGREPRDAFDGRGSCFIELGDGRAGYATGDFYAAEAPQVKMRRPGRHWHLLRVAFEQYWLRGPW